MKMLQSIGGSAANTLILSHAGNFRLTSRTAAKNSAYSGESQTRNCVVFCQTGSTSENIFLAWTVASGVAGSNEITNRFLINVIVASLFKKQA